MGSQGISCTVYVSALRRYTIPEEKERPSFLCLSGAWADYLISFTIWASRWKITASPMPSLLPSRPPRPILAQPYGRRLYVRLAGSVMTPHWSSLSLFFISLLQHETPVHR